MSILLYNETLKSAFHIAKAFAKENYNEQFGAAHLLRSLLHKEIGLLDFLESINKDWHYMTDWAEVRIDDYSKTTELPSDPQPDDRIEQVIDEADEVRLRLGFDEITPLCVLTALLKPHIGFSPEQLKSFP